MRQFEKSSGRQLETVGFTGVGTFESRPLVAQALRAEHRWTRKAQFVLLNPI